MTLPYRIRQFLNVARANRQHPPEIPDDARALLSEPMEHQFRILPPVDQSHLLDVYGYLVAHGAEQNTVTAGLIHDVGKACMKCNITVVDRAAHVLLSRFVPGIYRLFAQRERVSGRLMGLHRLANHAARGALAADQAGYNERVCWLVQYHESGGDSSDPELQLLREADRVAGMSGPEGSRA